MSNVTSFGANDHAMASDIDDQGGGGIVIGAAAFLDFGNEMKRKLDGLANPKPIIKPVGGSAIGATGVNPLLVKVQVKPASGRIWNILKLGLFGSDAHTSLSPGSAEQSGAEVTSATAGQNIASITLGPGTYDLYGTTLPSGTLAAADNNNLELQQVGAGGGTLMTLPLDAAPSPNQAEWGPVRVSLTNSSTTINVKAIAAASTGAVYYASLTAIPVGSTVNADVYAGQLPDPSLSQLPDAIETDLPIPTIIKYSKMIEWVNPQEELYALVYNVPNAQQVVLTAKVAEYPIDAIEAMSV